MITIEIRTIREIRDQDLDSYLKEQIEFNGFRFDPLSVKEGHKCSWSDNFGFTRATTSIQIIRRN